jgi:hypothetical protein
MKRFIRPALWKYALALLTLSFAVHLRWDEISRVWQPLFHAWPSYAETRFLFIEQDGVIIATTGWAVWAKGTHSGSPGEIARQLSKTAISESSFIFGSKRYSNFFHIATRWQNPLNPLVEDRLELEFDELTPRIFREYSELIEVESHALDRFFDEQRELPIHLKDQMLMRGGKLEGYQAALRANKPSILDVHWSWLLADVSLSLACLWSVVYLACAPWQSVRGIRQRKRRARGLCATCGYDLDGVSSRCPECGDPAPEQIAAP